MLPAPSLSTASRVAVATVIAIGVVTLIGTGAFAANPTSTAHSTGSPLSKTTTPMCTPSQVREDASTNHAAYPPGEMIVMKSSITNISGSACAIALGFQPGSSPAFLVANSSGTQVWSRCWIHDEPGACSQVFHTHTLRSGRTYEQKATWDQKSGPDGGPVVQVPQGQYTYSTFYAFLPYEPSATFDITVG
jgi:hypothetical protein